jgi:hypothetical protein
LIVVFLCEQEIGFRYEYVILCFTLAVATVSLTVALQQN